jgi:small ubiquitin-related modifier
MYDGDNIGPDQTPKTLEMDDKDQIDCMLEQTGGRGPWL